MVDGMKHIYFNEHYRADHLDSRTSPLDQITGRSELSSPNVDHNSRHIIGPQYLYFESILISFAQI